MQSKSVEMSQPTCFALPPGSPSPKRLRLSLKYNRQLAPESLLISGYCETKHEPAPVCIDERSNYCAVQDENASPNCSFSQSKQSPEISLELENRIEEPSVLGLPNCGNTCYVNSILQVLRYTPEFIKRINSIVSYQNFLIKICSNAALQEAKFFTKLRELYIAMRKQEAVMSKNTDNAATLVKPVRAFLSSLRDMSCMFEEGEQHDAHELFLTVISTFSSVCQILKDSLLPYNVNQEMNSSTETIMEIDDVLLTDTVCIPNKELKKSKSQVKRQQRANYIRNRAEKISKDMKDMNLGFEGILRYIILCLECENKVERLEQFMNLEVTIPDDLVDEDTVELVECLIPQINVLNGENKYFCNHCFHLNEATIHSQIVTLPPILLLHCGWKKQSSNMIDIEKDCLKILIPMTINTSENTDVFACREEQIYQLYAIVLHLGNSTEVGHYVSFIKDLFPVSESSNSHTSNESNACKDFQCEDEDMLKTFDAPASRWFLFDDENVTSVTINGSSSIFPYYDYLGITASPCMIFYCKYETTFNS